MARINVTLPDNLLDQVDRVAREDYATRSEIIRYAILFYMRFSFSTLDKSDFETMLKAMKSRQMRAYLNGTLYPGRGKRF